MKKREVDHALANERNSRRVYNPDPKGSRPPFSRKNLEFKHQRKIIAPSMGKYPISGLSHGVPTRYVIDGNNVGMCGNARGWYREPSDLKSGQLYVLNFVAHKPGRPDMMVHPSE